MYYNYQPSIGVGKKFKSNMWYCICKLASNYKMIFNYLNFTA